MKNNDLLTASSLLSILFMTFHLTSDTLRARAGTSEAGGVNLYAAPILVVWLCGTLMLAERRSGHVIMLVGSLMALGMPILHTRGSGNLVGSGAASSGAAFLFVWTLHALGVTGLFSLILSVQGLWNLRSGRQPAVPGGIQEQMRAS